jgi:hypothetical protein
MTPAGTDAHATADAAIIVDDGHRPGTRISLVG